MVDNTRAVVAGLSLCLVSACATRGPTAREVARQIVRDPAFIEAVSRRVATNQPARAEAPPRRPLWPAALHRTEPVLLDRTTALRTDEIVTTFAVTITAAGELYLDARPVTEAELEAAIRGVEEGREARAVIAADARVAHARVVQVIDLLRRSGIARFAVNVQTN
jgi:biopolymer transport protein ExbD